MRIKNHYIKLYNVVVSHENSHQNTGDFYRLKFPI